MEELKIVNVDEYPIEQAHCDEEGEPSPLVRKCREQLEQRGFASLPNFLTPEAIRDLTSSVLELEEMGVGFRSSDCHNVFLEENDGGGEGDRGGEPSTHPRQIRLKSSKLILNACDLAQHGSSGGLETLFNSRYFLGFVSDVLQTRLYPSADSYGKYYANVFRPGDGLNWHFDRSEYSISLILRPAEAGGEFQFAPDSRHAVETWDHLPPDLDGVERALGEHGESLAVERPELRAGDMYVFRGRHALHRVSEIVEGTRINLILTFNAEPDLRLNGYTLKKFFGLDAGDA